MEKWLRAWSLSRNLSPPLAFKSGFKVDVGYEKQKRRYVFPGLNDDFVELANHITEPWVFLKVCAFAGDVKSRIPGRWKMQPQGYMMDCVHGMHVPDRTLPADYRFEYEYGDAVSVVRICAQNGESVSVGRLVLVNDLAVYDRIVTEEKHRRKGLAGLLMKELEKIALAKGVFKNFLVATEEGRFLYEALGWKLYSFYTSAVLYDENPE